MHIRTATMDDLDAVTAVEAACFPAAEAAPTLCWPMASPGYGGVCGGGILFSSGRRTAAW